MSKKGVVSDHPCRKHEELGFTYHCVGEFESGRLQSPDDTQWLPDDNILGVFPPDFGFEAICNPILG